MNTEEKVRDLVNAISNKKLTMSVQCSGYSVAKAKQPKETRYRRSLDGAIYALKILAFAT